MNTKSKVDELLEKQEDKAKKQKEEIENVKLACKDIFQDVNAKFFLVYLKKICGWNEQGVNINNNVLAYKKGRRDIWLIVRNILPKDVLAQVEIYSDKTMEE